MEKNPNGTRPVKGGNTLELVKADGDDMVHSDGKTSAKAVELIHRYRHMDRPFFLGVGFVRPHVPFVAPEKYFPPFLPYDSMVLPEKVPGDWDDIPVQGINYKTSINMKMDIRRQKKAVGGYYAAVSFVDAQVGKVMQALERDSSGILITDITTDFGRLHRIIGALKQHVPDLVTIAVSDTRDSSNMVSLINYGQVFRYEVKPVAPKQLRVDINAAAIKHVTLRSNPSLEYRHSVEELPLESHAPSYERDLGAVVGLRERRGQAMSVQP